MKKILVLSAFILSFFSALFGQSINLTNNLGTINTCNANFFDSGGMGANYQNSENFTVTFCPAGGGSVQLNFTSFNVENFFDSLTIYDSPNANVNYLGSYSGNLSPFSVTATNPSGCLTLVFRSDLSITQSGWEATVSCTAPALALSASTLNTACNTTDGIIDLTASGGTPPYVYLWNTGAGSEDIMGLAPGGYSVTVTDSSGYSVTDTFYVSASNFTIGTSLTNTACDSTGGAVVLTMSGGTTPYNISWNNGQTGGFIDNLSPGGYSATIYDANGCFGYWSGYIEPEDSCTITISGYVYSDLNGNCVQDGGENPIVNAFVNLTPGGAAFTDDFGYYKLEVAPGTYDVTYYASPFMNTSTCANGLTQHLVLPNYGMNAFNTDFPLLFFPVQDLAVSLYDGSYVPGVNHSTHILYQNNSSMSMSPVLTWQHDSLITPTAYSLPPTSYNAATHTAVWNLGLMPSLTFGNIFINSLTDTTATLTTITGGNAQITPLLGDADLTDNQDTTAGIVVASFDPNQKGAFPQGEGVHHFISPTQNLLHYTLDFQNTGNYPAGFIVLRDTLDPSLDAFSVQLGVYSHPYTVTLQNDNILVFRFDNINLPDSMTNEPESHGFVTYSIQTQPGLPLGTAIHNSAAIYFDFNEPVMTNTTLHTVYLPPFADIDNATACEGQDITTNVSNGVPPYIFSWSNGTTDPNNQTGTFTTSFPVFGTYSVFVEDMYGVVSNGNTVSVSQVPADAGFSYTINGNTLSLTPNVVINANYLWDFGNGQTSTLVSPTFTATQTQHIITLTITNDCGTISSNQTFIATAIASPNQGKIRISPNPMTEQAELIVDFPTQKPYSVIITDITGKIVKQWEGISQEKMIIRKEMLSAGTYFVQIKGENGYIEKLIVR